MSQETALAVSQNGVVKIPTLQELVEQSEQDVRENALMVILNQPPPTAWLKEHPMIPGYKYLPIERVEYMLSRIFTKWWVDIKDSKVMANSVVVTVRLNVKNPITGEIDYQEGIGASPIQTNKGATAMDMLQTKNDAIMKAAPAAESYAIKDAAEKFGKLFGKDLARKDQIGYDSLLKATSEVDEEDLRELYRIKKVNGALSAKDIVNYERILKNKEVASYSKMQKELSVK